MRSLLPFILLLAMSLLASCGASKELTAEMETTRSELAQCQAALSNTQQQLTEAQSRSADWEDQMTHLTNENQALREQLANSQAQLVTVTQQMQASSDNYGVWYRVQIGAYEERQIDNSLETTDQLSLEKKGELQKVALGRFRNYEDAKKLQTQLQAMGLKDAWIVSYKDGVRVPIEQVRG